jgi:hypothetical protein
MSRTDERTFDPTPLLMWGPDVGEWDVDELYGFAATPQARRLTVLLAEATVIDGGRAVLRAVCGIGRMVFARARPGNPDLLRAVELAEAGDRDALEVLAQEGVRERASGRPREAQAEIATYLASFAVLVLGEPCEPMTAWYSVRAILSHAIELSRDRDEADSMMERCASVAYRELFYSRPLVRSVPKPKAKRTKAKRSKRAA